MATPRILHTLAVSAAAMAPAAAQDATPMPVCVGSGHQYQVGDYACLPGCHGRQRYARCDSLGASAAWTYISEVCPIASISPELPADATLTVTTVIAATSESAVAPAASVTSAHTSQASTYRPST